MLKVRPYSGDSKNMRPMANYIIIVLVSVTLLAIAFSNQPSGMLSKYGPLIILVLLLICVIYSAIALIKDIKESCAKKGEEAQEDMNKSFNIEMKEYNNRLRKETMQGMGNYHNLNESARTMSKNIEKKNSYDEGEDSPDELQFSNILQKLNELKHGKE